MFFCSAFVILGFVGNWWIIVGISDHGYRRSLQTFMLIWMIFLLKAVVQSIMLFILQGIATRFSRKTYSTMVYRILHAPIRGFLELIPTNRLMAIFTADLATVDQSVHGSIKNCILSFCSLLADMAVLIFFFHYYSVVIVIIFSGLVVTYQV
jgi:ABC-type multidrug transport system fused ATPase/permease subunit